MPSWWKKWFCQVPQMSMKIHLLERAWKTDQENGMVCHVSTKTSRVIGDQKFKKCENLAESAKYLDLD